MSGLYVAYRYGEHAALGGRVYDRLVARFGAAAVAREDPHIVGEAERTREAHHAARYSQVVVLVMGMRWLDAQDQSRTRLIDQPQDPIRVLVSEALKRRVRILPILADGFIMPPASDMPDELAALATINALDLDSGRRFEDDMHRILSILSQWLGRHDDEKKAESADAPKAPSLWSRIVHATGRAMVAVFSVPESVGQRQDNPGAIKLFGGQAVLFGVGVGVTLGLILHQILPSIIAALGIIVFYGTLYLLFEWRLLISVFSALPWSAVGWWLGDTWALSIHATEQTAPFKLVIPWVVGVAVGFFGLALNLSLYRRSSVWQTSGSTTSAGATPRFERIEHIEHIERVEHDETGAAQ